MHAISEANVVAAFIGIALMGGTAFFVAAFVVVIGLAVDTVFHILFCEPKMKNDIEIDSRPIRASDEASAAYMLGWDDCEAAMRKRHWWTQVKAFVAAIFYRRKP